MSPEAKKFETLAQETLKDALQRYRSSENFYQHARTQNTQYAYNHDISHFSFFCQERGINSLAFLKPQDLNLWLETMSKNGNSVSTIQRRQSTIFGFLDWAEKEGLIAANEFKSQIPRWKEDRLKRRSRTSLTQEQVNTLINSARAQQDSQRDAAFIVIAVQTGAKLEQIIKLNRGDILQEKNKMRIRFYNRKYEPEIAKVNKTAQEIVDKFLEEVDGNSNSPLFTNKRKKGRITRCGLWFVLKKYQSTIGTDKLTPTTLRDTYFETKKASEKKF